MNARAAGMVITGFDPGFTAPGITSVARRPGGGYLQIASKVVRKPSPKKGKQSLTARLNQIADELMAHLIKHRPAFLAIEEQLGAQVGGFKSGQFNGNNGKTMMVVGVAVAVARALRIPIVWRTPKQVKLAVLGTGGSTGKKTTVQNAYQRIVGEESVAQDGADAGSAAIAVFQMHPIERAA